MSVFKNRFCFSFLIFTISFGNVIAMSSSKALEGYPAGYLPDCPGSTITKEIPPKDLKFLTISVQRKSSIFSVKPAYNYFEMEKLAKDPGADFTKPIVMFVGGYLDHPTYPIGTIIGSVYKKLGFTVLLLNMQMFTFQEYAIASRNLRAVGKHTAEMLSNLTAYGLDPKRLSLVGISLGGQAISFIGKNFRELTGMNISRITGLDPAGPCFRNLGPKDRLDESDADFVDVILTNIDGFGMAAPVGHVNFYVNGGEFQPGDVLWMPCNVLCSHIRSYTIWIAALHYPDRFIALKCDSVQEARDRNCYDHKPLSTNVLGLNTDKNNKGIFYLATVNNYPYFLGEKGLKRDNEFFDMQVNLTRRNF